MEGIIKYTRAQWIAGNFILGLHEQGQETDTNLAKIGDGSTAWNNLPYSSGIAKMTTAERTSYLPNGNPAIVFDTDLDSYYKFSANTNTWSAL